jgi:hypothetical protein
MNSKLRKEFLEDLPINVKSKVRGVDIALINEAIAAVQGGHATINDQAPDTREKRFIVIVSYFKKARTNYHIAIDDAAIAEHNDTVEIKYKEPDTYKSPRKSGVKSKHHHIRHY